MSKFASRLSSIRTQLVILVLVSSVPALGAVIWFGIELERQAVKAAHTEALMAVRDTAFEHERALETTRQLLLALSKFREVQKLKPAAGNQLLRKMLDSNQMLSNLLVAGTNGEVISSALSFSPLNIGHRKYFRDAMSTRKFSVGEYVVGIIVKEPVLHLANPVFDGKNRLVAVASAAVSLQKYGMPFRGARLPPGSSLVISDHRGVTLFSYANTGGA